MNCNCPNCLNCYDGPGMPECLFLWWQVIDEARTIRDRFGNLSPEESRRLSDDELENLVEANGFAVEVLATQDAYVDASYDHFSRFCQDHNDWQWYCDYGPFVAEFEAQEEAEYEAEYEARDHYEAPREWDWADICTPEEIEGVLEMWDTIDGLTGEQFDSVFVKLLAYARWEIAFHYDVVELEFGHVLFRDWDWDDRMMLGGWEGELEYELHLANVAGGHYLEEC